MNGCCRSFGTAAGASAQLAPGNHLSRSLNAKVSRSKLGNTQLLSSSSPALTQGLDSLRSAASSYLCIGESMVRLAHAGRDDIRRLLRKSGHLRVLLDPDDPDLPGGRQDPKAFARGQDPEHAPQRAGSGRAGRTTKHAGRDEVQLTERHETPPRSSACGNLGANCRRHV